MNKFTIYPAIDLMNGNVVRLKQGDPAKKTVYSSKPEQMAKKWSDVGAKWLHIVNLDGAFDDEDATELSRQCYEDTFYQANDSILQVSLYVEHLARVTILKCAIEHLIDNLKDNYKGTDLSDQLNYLTLPTTIKTGLNEILKDKYFYWNWY